MAGVNDHRDTGGTLIPGVDYANTTPSLTPAVFTNRLLTGLAKQNDTIIELLKEIRDSLRTKGNWTI